MKPFGEGRLLLLRCKDLDRNPAQCARSRPAPPPFASIVALNNGDDVTLNHRQLSGVISHYRYPHAVMDRYVARWDPPLAFGGGHEYERGPS